MLWDDEKLYRVANNDGIRDSAARRIIVQALTAMRDDYEAVLATAQPQPPQAMDAPDGTPGIWVNLDNPGNPYSLLLERLKALMTPEEQFDFAYSSDELPERWKPHPAAQPQPVAPSPRWEDAPEWAEWWAVDCDGATTWFPIEPTLDIWDWLQHPSDWAATRGDPIDIPIGIDWRTLKQRRPQA